ncbi:50S ribosomal protein L6 [Hydrangea phyllody phytoplasma]|uniref:Large ribosomal subunit protein uL6 n=3 Tax=16SrI (Aster yellows group) TaxID=3042590 RepID=A0ABQ5PSB1_9MOLU|nr:MULTISPECIES: 50S ribosomal protein L6 [16SrI (Aster yellows group)]MBS2993785.1 50S ribosomal protein L6 ['Santalum album' aster yellows phytoplasma]GFZ75362.1 50S ribosomal protein L6 [Hydrangea phyllody phytoplasma]GLH61363.1 50S ribosomal protein L6 [Rhus yellows phytoplasma]GLH61628.1 50S ribosomal protein L6 [Hydrangea phyllody phytoplasma]
MSRVGNKAIEVPNAVKVDIKDRNFISVEGPKGKLEYQFNHKLTITNENKVITVKRPNDEIFMKKIHGTTRALLSNMVEGVSKGFQKTLKIVGLAYRAQIKDKQLILSLGFSHPVSVAIPDNLEVVVNQNTEIVIKGIDKQLVGEFAAKNVKLRKPEPYKGKGIRYVGQYVRQKAGKSAKKTRKD